jgi:hypothetical protein
MSKIKQTRSNHQDYEITFFQLRNVISVIFTKKEKKIYLQVIQIGREKNLSPFLYLSEDVRQIVMLS